MLNSENKYKTKQKHQRIPQRLGCVIDPRRQVHRLQHVSKALNFPALKRRKANKHHCVAKKGLNHKYSIGLLRIFIICILKIK